MSARAQQHQQRALSLVCPQSHGLAEALLYTCSHTIIYTYVLRGCTIYMSSYHLHICVHRRRARAQQRQRCELAAALYRLAAQRFRHGARAFGRRALHSEVHASALFSVCDTRYVCIYIYIYTRCVCVCMHIYIYRHDVCVCMHLYIYIGMICVCVHTFIHKQARRPIRVLLYKCIHLYIRIDRILYTFIHNNVSRRGDLYV